MVPETSPGAGPESTEQAQQSTPSPCTEKEGGEEKIEFNLRIKC